MMIIIISNELSIILFFYFQYKSNDKIYEKTSITHMMKIK